MLTRRDIGRTVKAWLPVLEQWEKTAWIASATQLFCLIGFGLGLPFLPMYVQALGVTERAQVAVWSGVISGSAALTPRWASSAMSGSSWPCACFRAR